MVNGVDSYSNAILYMQMARSRPSPAEMFNKMFNKMDSDGSGGISQSELDAFGQGIAAQTGSTIDTANAVATYDADGNGELSQDELQSFMKATMPQSGEMTGVQGGHHHHHGAGGLFKAIDTDSNGSISQTELDQWATAFSENTGNSIDTTGAVSTYDTDGDGQLSRSELKSFLEANGIKPPSHPPKGTEAMNGTDSASASSTGNASDIISAFDTNGDGVLDSSELQAYLNDSSRASFKTLVQQAVSAYAMNLGSNFPSQENGLLNLSGLNTGPSINCEA